MRTSDAGRTPVIARVPYEDLRELWYWGRWKERVGRGLGYDVVIVCTSRAACRRYHSGRTTDSWLIVDVGEAESGPSREFTDADLFNESGGGGERYNRVFTKLSLPALLAAVRDDEGGARDGNLVVLVNPRYQSGENAITADAIYPDTASFLASLPGRAHDGAAGLRICLRDPIPELAEAAATLSRAVDAHLAGDRAKAAELIASCNTPEIREWVESLWGKNSPYVKKRVVAGAPPAMAKALRTKARMPTTAERRALHERDGFHCRFCGIPVIRKGVRVRMQKAYPEALPWGTTNAAQHAAFQAMWAQYDHLLPHTRGGTNDLENLVVTCAPCNFGRMESTLEEVGVIDPRTRNPDRSSKWDGLERFR